MDLHLTLKPDLAGLASAQRVLMAFLARADCADDVSFRAELVVEEVVMNIIRHASVHGATAIRLSARCEAGQADLVVEDDGPAFDPLAAPARPLRRTLDEAGVGGFGLHLIRSSSDGSNYRRTAGGANRLEFSFAPRPATTSGEERKK